MLLPIAIGGVASDHGQWGETRPSPEVRPLGGTIWRPFLDWLADPLEDMVEPRTILAVAALSVLDGRCHSWYRPNTMKARVPLQSLKRKRGRPSLFDWDVAEEICRRIAEGETLRSVCGLDHMPAHTTVLRWLQQNEEFRSQYAHAREAQADALADEMVEIARSATNQDAHAKRLLVDVLKWRAAKLRPKVYGDRTRIETEKPEDHSRLSPAELRERIATLLRSAGFPEEAIRALVGPTPDVEVKATGQLQHSTGRA